MAHGIELGGGVRQGSFGGGAGAGFLDPVGGDVAAGDAGASAGYNQRELAGVPPRGGNSLPLLRPVPHYFFPSLR